MKKLALAAWLLLSACATTDGATPTTQRVEFRCDHGAAFSVRYNDQGGADVFAGGQTYTLPGVPAASGTRYTNGTVEFWEHHGDAMLNGAAGGPYTECHLH